MAHTTWTTEDLEDLLGEAISDSFDMDWQPSWGAKAILRALEENGLRISKAPEQAFRDLCTEHGVQSASIGFYAATDARPEFFDAALYTWDGMEVTGRRGNQMGASLDAALTAAIEQLREYDAKLVEA